MGVIKKLLGLDGGTPYDQYPAGEPIRNQRELAARTGPGVTIVTCRCGAQFSSRRTGGFTCPACTRRHD